jgi:chemotaxis response regulator CheB
MDAGDAETCLRTADTSARRRRAARVLIIDNQPIVREGLRRIIELEDDLLVCAEADTLKGARAAIREANPDVIIADISLNQGDGLGLLREVRAHYPPLPILVLSIHDETIYAERISRSCLRRSVRVPSKSRARRRRSCPDSAAVSGGLRKNPCTSVQHSSCKNSSCARSSTPSATTSSLSVFAIAIMVAAITLIFAVVLNAPDK